MAKKFKTPFAFTGDKTTVPDALQPDGSVSYTQGFGPDYELDKLVDPINAKDVPRDQTNQLFFDVTESIGEVQLYGAALWSADMAPYPINARVAYAGKYWRSNTAGNSDEPGVGAGWDDVSAQSPDFLNTTRIDVASASTVNLTTAAPNTRHINITGTTAITGFTVAAGQCYFVRFAGGLTLTNSASLVTQTGSNITTEAGDTCIIRATAANVVEVLAYTPLPATQAQTNAGTDDIRPVTPLKLKSGFSINLATTGHIKFPAFLGGLQICWGESSLTGKSTTPVTYDRAFTQIYQTLGFRDLAGTDNVSSLNMTAQTNTGFSQVNTGSVACIGRYIAIGLG